MEAEIKKFYISVGHQIRKCRNKSGLTQEALAKALRPQMTRVSIANIESGAQRILAHTLYQIAGTLNASMSDLLPVKGIDAAVNSSDIISELSSKLGISKSQAKRITEQAKNPMTESKP